MLTPAIPVFPETSPRTGPWPPGEPANFQVPGCTQLLLSPLPGIPETACGADTDDPRAARLRCSAEAVERITAWTGTISPVPPGATCLDPDLFTQDGCRPVPSGQDALVYELVDVNTAQAPFRIDKAAVCLGTTGWFPAGSTGYAAAPTRHQAILAASWEVVERDLLTAWWRGTETATRQEIDPRQRAELKPSGIDLSAIRIGPYCTVSAAFDEESELAAVGASAGTDITRRLAKATQEALITLAQLRKLLAEDVTDRAALDAPAENATGLEDTLYLLLDPRFTAQIKTRFVNVFSGPVGIPGPDDDPVRVLKGRGYRVFVTELHSPESQWAGLKVVRVLAAGAATPLPWAARPTELPVPLA